jgi:LacI family transcriptional regulator
MILGMRVRQKDIARELGMTVATVSKALRNRSDVGAGTLMRDYQEIVRRLVKLGHRRIGFFSSGRHLHAHRAFGAYLTAITHHGAEWKSDWWIDCQEDASLDYEERVLRAVRLTRDQHVTAWICRTPYLGVQLYQGMREAGIAMPGNVSLMAHSLGSESGEESPPLSGVGMPLRELGRHAMLELLERRRTPKRPVRTLLLPGQFIPGSTLAPPRAVS